MMNLQALGAIFLMLKLRPRVLYCKSHNCILLEKVGMTLRLQVAGCYCDLAKKVLLQKHNLKHWLLKYSSCLGGSTIKLVQLKRFS